MPTRKDIRLKNYDYSHNGAYFVTICTKNKMCIFWENNDKYKPFAAENGDGTNVPDAIVKKCLNHQCKYPKCFNPKCRGAFRAPSQWLDKNSFI